MSTKHPESADTSQDMISLATLPYDLLLNISRHLELTDIYALQLVSFFVPCSEADRLAHVGLWSGSIGRTRPVSRGVTPRLGCLKTCPAVNAIAQHLGPYDYVLCTSFG